MWFLDFSFSKKQTCEFTELRMNGLFGKVVVVSNLQYKS